MMRIEAILFPLVVALGYEAVGPAAQPVSEPASATLPMTLDHNRLTVEVELRPASGPARRVQAWVDTGGTDVIVNEPLARDLGVDLSALPAGGEHSVDTPTPVPEMRLGGILLDTGAMNLSVHPGRFARPGVQAACVLPARCLRNLHVIFDYPEKKLTVARPGVLKPFGVPVPIRINPETGLFMVEAEIEGEKIPLGVDTGSAGTWVSDRLTAAWSARHPDWPQATGAAGSTNFFGFPFETRGALLSLPNLRIGTVAVPETAVLGLDQRIFDWYSQKSAAPVSGFVGAELISRFRVEVDFPARMSWWRAGPVRRPRDLNMVGLTVKAESDGSITVAGVVSRGGKLLVAGVEPGDKLLAVGKLEAAGASMGAVIKALRGRPGELRRLRLERGGKIIVVTATVERLP